MPRDRVPAPLVLGLAWAVGTVPVANLAARRLAGVDLRNVGSGTVSGSGLYEVAGFPALAAVGCLELAKGATAAALAGRRRTLGAAASAAAIVGHDWSPWLRGAGGRGLSLALGSGAVLAPEATVTLGLGLGLGRLARQTGLGCFLAIAVLPALLRRTRGRTGVWIALALGAPQLVKRLAGNGPVASAASPSTYLWRLVLDRDTRTGGARRAADANP